jgi:hypothetical protein
MTEHRLPDPRMIPAWQGLDADQPEPDRNPADADLADDTLVRPFLVTGGRTEPLHDGLRLESLVHSSPAARSAPLRFELRQIVDLCRSPTTVADVAARLGVPLGVARVLIADLVSGGYATVSRNTEVPIDVIERIRDRVRAL